MSSAISSSPTARSSMDVDTDFAGDGATTIAPSSPMSNTRDAAIKWESHSKSEERPDVSTSTSDLHSQDLQTRLTRLDILLKKSTVYSRVLGERMSKARRIQETEDDVGGVSDTLEANTRDESGRGQVQSKSTLSGSDAGSKRGRQGFSDSDSPRSRLKRLKTDVNATEAVESESELLFKQPDAITGTTLRDYQLLGVAWMASLWENGVNGILADEMGLGKTLQTIAFLAYVRQRGAANKTLIVCPLSVLHNWVDEFEKFAPSIPVCMYHGTPTERAEIRRTHMNAVDDKARSKRRTSNPPKKIKATKASGYHRQGGSPKMEFPIVLTTYEMIIKDRKHLAQYKWNFIIVDEGHRLKNMDCRLVQEIKKYESANRLILTGTPLHNNLAELWSLLNFILPDIFQDLDSFQQWFNLPSLQSMLPSEQSDGVISKLHGILKPFLLRRLKVDVERSLPPKKEYVLYAPLSERQRGVYDAVLNGALRGYLIKEHEKTQDQALLHNPKWMDGGRTMRKRAKVNYQVDSDDDQWFDRLQEGEFVLQNKREEEHDLGRQFQRRAAVKQVNSLKLQNTVMQLRKVCSHPFLFEWPSDPETLEPVVDEQLVNASGKMMVLDRLLNELFKRRHKVLLFSQFTTMLDIIEEWATSHKHWSTCRIDGSTGPMDRRAEMHRFQDGGSDPQAPWLFLLSTRAGGLGINLTAADTVIFYDQDWNPQMDLQAMDRAHRIGQTKPVLIFRLVSAHTVETKIMQRANEKRKLEALVIAKGKFRMPGSTSHAKPQTVAEMAASLLKLEGEKIEVVPNSDAGKVKVISDADLEKLLDRSPEVFADRGQGWTSGAKTTSQGEETGVAFEVFKPQIDECNDGLAGLMGEEIE